MKPKASLMEMLKAGVHFGHQTFRWHPSMKPFIFASKNDIHIIDLERTQEQLEKALEFVAGVVKNNGQILFVGTKKQAKEIMKKSAQKVDMPFVVERWLGGIFTNFTTVRKQVDKLEKMIKEKEDDLKKRYTKKELLVRKRKIEKLTKFFEGLLIMKRLPEAIFVIDVKQEKNAIAEAKKRKIPVIALVDTNSDMRKIDYPIPSNDDAVKVIQLMCDEVVSVISETKKK